MDARHLFFCPPVFWERRLVIETPRRVAKGATGRISKRKIPRMSRLCYHQSGMSHIRLRNVEVAVKVKLFVLVGHLILPPPV